MANANFQKALDQACDRMGDIQVRMYREALAKYPEAEEIMGQYYIGGPDCYVLYVGEKEVGSVLARNWELRTH